MVAPPLKVGAVYDTLRRPDEGSMAEIVGASGTRDGVPVAELLAVPAPAGFTARIRTVYWAPFTRPETTNGDEVPAGLRAVHVVPSREYS